uniref:Ig-like domain-containing protein n=1 Tax=Takifugu rubripes TaxID=31033 RepID=A0A674PLC0_TAKRU
MLNIRQFLLLLWSFLQRWNLGCGFFWLLFCRGEDKVMQPPEDVVAAEGDTVTLDCTFQTTYTNPNLFWYKQDGTSRPQFILSRFKGDTGKTEDEFKERFSSTLNSTMKSAPLKIQELQLSDSAVYYCALRPTVTGSSRSAH